MSKVQAHEIKRALAKKHTEDVFLTEVKNGPTNTSNNLLIMDALAIKKSWSKPCITGYEVKVDRRDFLRDTKWHGYLNYCHRFYFVCPSGTIQPDELGEGIGMIWFNQETGSLSTRKAAAFKPIELPTELLYYIVMNRTVQQPHPFFSSRREFLESWLEDKEERYKIGSRIGTKMAWTIKEMEDKVDELEGKMSRLESTSEKYNRLLEILRQAGVNTSGWRWEDDLVERLRNGTAKDVRYIVDQMQRQINSLQKIVGGAEA